LKNLNKQYHNVKSIKKNINKANFNVEVINICPQCRVIFNYDRVYTKVLQSVSEELKPENELEYYITDYDNANSFDCPHWCMKNPDGFCDL